MTKTLTGYGNGRYILDSAESLFMYIKIGWSSKWDGFRFTGALANGELVFIKKCGSSCIKCRLSVTERCGCIIPGSDSIRQNGFSVVESCLGVIEDLLCGIEII